MFRNHHGCSNRVCQIMNPRFIALTFVVAMSVGSAGAQENRSDGQQREILQGLESGANALRALGRNDEAARLIEIGRQISTPPENRDRPQEQERNVSDRNNTDRAPNARNQAVRGMNERLVAERQRNVFRMAHDAFREADRGDAMDQVERIIHESELLLSGRRDEEAQQAIREMPGREDQIELLTRASGIWKELGDADKSQAVAALADQLRQRENRTRNADRTETREQPASGRPTGERQVNRDRQMEQFQQQLMQLTAQIEQLQKQLNEIRDRR